MTIERSDPRIAARESQWDEEVAKQLPDLLIRLLNSPIYGLGKGRDLPPAAYGVYLFSEKGKPRYVGRVGLTERSKRAGKKFSNFRTRLRGPKPGSLTSVSQLKTLNLVPVPFVCSPNRASRNPFRSQTYPSSRTT